MKLRVVLVMCVLVSLAPPAVAQEAPMTPKSIVQAYEALADTILAVRKAEAGFVRSMLDGHRHAAEVLYAKGSFEAAAAEMALFANEGDNAIGGVRKRLLEGGHHFNAAGEEAGIFEDGYVIVTREAKAKLLAASAQMRTADEEGRKSAWTDFTKIATELVKSD